MKRSSKRQFYGDKRIGGMSRYDQRAAKVAEMRAKLAAGTLDMPHRLSPAVSRMIDAECERHITRRTPPQLTDQASLDGQSREIDSMCSNDTEGM